MKVRQIEVQSLVKDFQSEAKVFESLVSPTENNGAENAAGGCLFLLV